MEPAPETSDRDFRYDTAVISGRFYPFHRGHEMLLDEALKLARRVYVFVSARSAQTVPAETRASWILEIIGNPRLTVGIIDQAAENLPNDDSRAWAEVVLRHLGFRPDVVVTSESTQTDFAAHMGADLHQVDPERHIVPVSGTELRSDLEAFKGALHPLVYEAVKNVRLADDKQK